LHLVDCGGGPPAAKDAGLKKIDFILLTHYHSDHAGGVSQLAAKIAVRGTPMAEANLAAASKMAVARLRSAVGN
jgi:glyoxylase-like metal-dependent hydrolase (beta-lactamase superfamily II)